MLKCENLPRKNSTIYETQNILVKFQQNEHTPARSRQTKELGRVCNADQRTVQVRKEKVVNLDNINISTS